MPAPLVRQPIEANTGAGAYLLTQFQDYDASAAAAAAYVASVVAAQAEGAPARSDFRIALSDEELERVLPILRAVPLLVHLSEDGLLALLSHSAWRNFRRSEPLITEGARSSPKYVYVLLSGEIEITEEVKEREQTQEEAGATAPSRVRHEGALIQTARALCCAQMRNAS